MTTPRFFFSSLGPVALVATIVMAAMASGCSSPSPDARIIFPAATFNGQPARLVLDTGAQTSLMQQSTAKRLGVKFTPVSTKITFDWFADAPAMALSDEVQLAAGTEIFSAQWPVVDLAGAILDGLIGWAGVRDNILVFDAITHTVRGVGALPPETAQWTRLKIRNDGMLKLEVPLANGHTGIILTWTPDARLAFFFHRLPGKPGWAHIPGRSLTIALRSASAHLRSPISPWARPTGVRCQTIILAFWVSPHSTGWILLSMVKRASPIYGPRGPKLRMLERRTGRSTAVCISPLIACAPPLFSYAPRVRRMFTITLVRFSIKPERLICPPSIWQHH